MIAYLVEHGNGPIHDRIVVDREYFLSHDMARERVYALLAESKEPMKKSETCSLWHTPLERGFQYVYMCNILIKE